MKKIFLFIALFFLLSITPSFVYAQENILQPDGGAGSQAIINPYPIRRIQPNFFGEKHSYTVTMRGNGEAVVTFKSILANLQNKPLSKITLVLPSTTQPRDVAAYQVLQETTCLRYKPQLYQVSPSPIVYQQTGIYKPLQIAPAPPNLYKPQPPQCEEYQQPDFEDVSNNATTYQAVSFEIKKDQLTLLLPKPIAPNSSGSYFLYFRTFGYVQKELFGGYDFTFETLKINEKINSLTIGINTDSDYILRDAKGKINYQAQNTSASMPVGVLSTDYAIANQQIDNFYASIGQGSITKTENDLGSGETYKLTGSYADSQWKLYGHEISIGIGITLCIIMILLIVIKIVIRKMAHHTRETLHVDKQDHDVMHPSHLGRWLLISAGVSFISTFLLFFYTIAIFIASTFFNSLTNNTVLLMCLFAISMAVYIFFLFAPAITIGLKKGLNWGLNTFGFTIIWSIFFLVILLTIVFLFFSNNNGGYVGAMKAFSPPSVKINSLPQSAIAKQST